MNGPRVLVIVPTHDHASTVDLAVESALRQTVADIEVVVVGDGASDAVQAAVTPLLADPRLRYLDRPKSPGRGEATRHELLTATSAPFAAYLGDDDLLLPDHLEQALALLEQHDFMHALPVMVERDGTLRAFPVDLARPECVSWHLEPNQNAISLTGVVHRVDAYRALPFGWRTAPPGRWSDHFMWEQWFTQPDVRLATMTRATTLKLDSTARRDMDGPARREELLAWSQRMRRATFVEELEQLAADAFRRAAVQGTLDSFSCHTWLVTALADVDQARKQLASVAAAHDALAAETAGLANELERLRVEVADLMATRVRLEHEIAAMRATRTWRAHTRVTTARPFLAMKRWSALAGRD